MTRLLAALFFSASMAFAADDAPPPADATPLGAVVTDGLYEPDMPTDPAALRQAILEQLKADGAPPELADALLEELASLVEAERKLQYVQGDVNLGDGLAMVKLGPDWRFLAPEQAADVIEAWGNPRPEPLPLGMIVPATVRALNPDSWAVLLSYEEEGHVDDADAAKTDFAQLLRDMQADTKAANEQRTAAGYDPLELVGWAEPPHYDAAGKKLYWAQHLRAPDGETLNYDIRVLGRKGVLAMSAVSAMEALDVVRPAMEDLIGRVEFKEGNRYADFDPDLDEVAAFGIGALIAGKAAAKVGFFKVILAALLAGKKLVVAGAMALVVGIKSLFTKKDSEDAG